MQFLPRVPMKPWVLCIPDKNLYFSTQKFETLFSTVKFEISCCKVRCTRTLAYHDECPLTTHTWTTSPHVFTSSDKEPAFSINMPGFFFRGCTERTDEWGLIAGPGGWHAPGHRVTSSNETWERGHAAPAQPLQGQIERADKSIKFYFRRKIKGNTVCSRGISLY